MHTAWPGPAFESTLKTIAYALTPLNFGIYSAPMNIELSALEERIRQTVELCRRLRDENRDLRQRLIALETDRQGLAARMDGARDRLENLLRQIPE